MEERERHDPVRISFVMEMGALRGSGSRQSSSIPKKIHSFHRRGQFKPRIMICLLFLFGLRGPRFPSKLKLCLWTQGIFPRHNCHVSSSPAHASTPTTLCLTEQLHYLLPFLPYQQFAGLLYKFKNAWFGWVTTLFFFAKDIILLH